MICDGFDVVPTINKHGWIGFLAFFLIFNIFSIPIDIFAIMIKLFCESLIENLVKHFLPFKGFS